MGKITGNKDSKHPTTKQCNDAFGSEGGPNNPIILACGKVYRYSIDSSAWMIDNHGPATVNFSFNGGLLILSVPNGYTIQAVTSNMNETNELRYNTNNKNSDGRGAHWMATSWTNQAAYIREMHQGNDRNNSWGSTDFNEFLSISYIIVGYKQEPI